MSKIILKLENISKDFDSASGKISVLKNINLEIKSGQSIALLGESGAGKTTLLNIASSLEKPSSGKVFWGDEQIDNMKNLAQKRASQIGFVFQSYYLMPELNALENVLIAAKIAKMNIKEARKRAKELFEITSLTDKLYSLPSKMSGGQRQRVAIVRALINSPKIIFADEPTGNLDEITAKNVMDTFFSVIKISGASLLMVTHNKLFAKQTDTQLYLKAGVFSNE